MITISLITGLYFFPQIVKPVVFTTYIGFGNILDLKTTFTVLVFLNILAV